MKKHLKQVISTLIILSFIPTVVYGSGNEKKLITDSNINFNEDNISSDKIAFSKTNVIEEELSSEDILTIEDYMDSQILDLIEEKKSSYSEEYLILPKNSSPIGTRAAKYEFESNDSFSLADRLRVGDTMYGTIDDEDDRDYFKIKFDEAGWVTIRLRDIPDYCDYDMYLFGQGYDLIESSQNGSSSNESVFLYVTPGIYYYIRIKSFDGYDRYNEYYLKAYWYEETETAFSVGTNFQSSLNNYDEIDTTWVARTAAEYCSDMGYETTLVKYPTYNILNRNSDSLNSSVVFLGGHGCPTHIYFNYNTNGNTGSNKYATGVSTTYKTMNDLGESENGFEYVSLKSKSIEDNRLIVFAACNTAASPILTSRNLPDYAVREGVETAIGWKLKPKDIALDDWCERFFIYLARGYTVIDAADKADEIFSSSSTVASWKIYGNWDNVVNLSGAYRSLSMTPSSIEDDENNLLSDEDVIEVNIMGNDLFALENYIIETFDITNLDEYELNIIDRGDGNYQIRYEYYLNDFDTQTGFFVKVKDDVVKYLSIKTLGNLKINNDNSLVRTSLFTNISIDELCQTLDEFTNSDDLEASETIAKELAKEGIPDDCTILTQTTEKIIIDSELYYIIGTEYALYYGTPMEIYGCSSYTYKIE